MGTLKCFVVMPFGDEFDAVFQTVREAAARATPSDEVDCQWLKDVLHPGIITDEIVASLTEAALCIADVTGSNPNVMWETGYAMALGKPTILIGQQVRELPFDLKVRRVLDYTPDKLSAFGEQLAEAIRQTLSVYELPTASRTTGTTATGALTIVVTGSARADAPRAQRRIETALEPYCGANALWYCGSNGAVDEAAVAHLLARDEHVVIVAYHRYDFSEGIRGLVEEGKVQYIDASVEALPRGMTGPSERDIFFCAKGDLVVLLWDGESRGTAKLVTYFQEHGRSLLLSFI